MLDKTLMNISTWRSTLYLLDPVANIGIFSRADFISEGHLQFYETQITCNSAFTLDACMKLNLHPVV
jgi:hypothetical protein